MRRHLRPAWVLVTLVPLALLLWMQYRWLESLQAVSTIANRAALDNALKSIATDVQYFYSSQAERTLNVPSSTFIEGSLQDIARTWSRREVEGIRRLFVVDFTQSPYGE